MGHNYQPKGLTLQSAATTATAGTAQPLTMEQGKATFQAYGTTSAGAGAATIKIQVSNVDVPGTNDWLDAGTMTLTLGTTSTSDGFAMDAAWVWVRSNVTAISGTGASVTVRMGG